MGKLIESRHYRFRQLSAGVVAAFAIDGGGAFANSGIIDLGDKTLVYDTSITPAAAVDLVRAAQQFSGRARIEYVVNSHYHKDHVRGNSVFPRDTHIVSTRITRDLLMSKGKQQIKTDLETIHAAIQHTDRQIVEHYDTLSQAAQQDLKFAAGWQRAVYESLQKLRLRFPDITFDRRIVINGSERRAVLVNFELAHTRSDVVLYLPEADTVFAADLVMPHRHRWLGELDLQAFEDALGFLKALNLKYVIPGHGEVTRSVNYDDELHYAQSVTALVQAALDKGASRETVLALECPPAYDSWRFKEMLFKRNLEALYDNLRPTNHNNPGVNQHDSVPYYDNP